jgi:hypothetical protein
VCGGDDDDDDDSYCGSHQDDYYHQDHRDYGSRDSCSVSAIRNHTAL